MSRKLTDEERELWERLSQTVRALPKRRAAKRVQPQDQTPEEQASSGSPRTYRPASPPTPERPTTPAPALAPFEQRTRRRLARGIAEVDARIDLHGMRQERAFNALVSFLRKAQSRDGRIVLVVTGKGRAGEGDRGVLRASVPAWLSRPDLRHLVVGWEEAGRRHGGAGALYVRIRQRRERGRRP